jgi:hypothetical protein
MARFDSGGVADTTGRTGAKMSELASGGAAEPAGSGHGASAAVFLGVARGVFAVVAVAVAGFDLLSGTLGLALWNRVRR